MRIDLLFKNMLIFKKRNEAKEMCLSHLIKVNGQFTKPSRKIHEGDIIEIETPQGMRKIRILQIPKGNIHKQNKDMYYEEIQG